MGCKATNSISLRYSARPSQERHLDKDGALCCGKQGLAIGRDSECHLRIDLPHISSWHAKISCLGDLFFLEDTESENGTSINNQRLETRRKYQLRDGDIVYIDDQPIEISVPHAEMLMRMDEEEINEEFIYDVLLTNVPNKHLPINETGWPSTRAGHDESEPAPEPEPKPVSAELVTPFKTENERYNDGKSLVSSFLAGIELDIEDVRLQPDEYHEFLGEMGQALFQAVDSVCKVLYTQNLFRDHFSVRSTVWNRSKVNPLYNAKIDTRRVIETLLTSPSDAIPSLVDAISEAREDFYLHGIAVPQSLDSAIRQIVETFNWQILEKEFESSPGFTGLGLLKKARFWELYCHEFDRQVKSLDEFDNRFNRHIANAYSQAREREFANSSTEENSDAE